MFTHPLCRHIRTNGKRCKSPAIRLRAFCYYHGSLNERHRVLATYKVPRPLPAGLDAQYMAKDPITADYYGLSPEQTVILDIPPLEDAASIQIGLSLLATALGKNYLDPRRASLLAYTLQVASNNLRHSPETTEPAEDLDQTQPDELALTEAPSNTPTHPNPDHRNPAPEHPSDTPDPHRTPQPQHSQPTHEVPPPHNQPQQPPPPSTPSNVQQSPVDETPAPHPASPHTQSTENHYAPHPESQTQPAPHSAQTPPPEPTEPSQTVSCQPAKTETAPQSTPHPAQTSPQGHPRDIHVAPHHP